MPIYLMDVEKSRICVVELAEQLRYLVCFMEKDGIDGGILLVVAEEDFNSLEGKWMSRFDEILLNEVAVGARSGGVENYSMAQAVTACV